MELHDLLDVPGLRLKVLTGGAGLDRPIRRVFTTDLRDPARYLSGSELVLSGVVWRRDPEDSADFVAALASRDVAGLAAGDAAFGSIPEDLVEACRSYGVPLLEVPIDVSFATITECVTHRLTREREGDPAAVLGQRRRLATTLAEGEGLDGLLSMWQREVGAPCWVLTPTGRPVAGTPPALETATAASLAEAYLRVGSLPHVIRGAAATPYTLFPVTQAGHRLVSWFLACEGDHSSWPGELHESVTELTSLIAFERARLDERRRTRWLLAEQLLRPVLSGTAEPASVADDLRASGLDLGQPYVGISLEASDRTESADVACAVLEELLGSRAAEPVVASTGDEAVALVRLPGALDDLAADLREAAGRLEIGLDRGRLLVGLGAAARGPAGLREAVAEARLARRLAALRPGHTSLLTCDDIDSHALLLATVPEDVRAMFRTRLLGPVLDYDARNGTDLGETLDEFLACSGSWSRCAERLHVHVNTLRYRIRRVEELTGRSLATLEDRVDFFLALRAG